MTVYRTMEENRERSYFTIDEQLCILQKRLEVYQEELNSELTVEDRQTFETYKAEVDEKMHLLVSRKEHLLQKPTFLLLIASDNDNKVFLTLPTYIETEDEAKFFAKSVIEKLLADNAVQLNDGGYIGIIVRNSLYKAMEDKVSVSQILANRKVYITSKQILASSDNISVF